MKKDGQTMTNRQKDNDKHTNEEKPQNKRQINKKVQKIAKKQRNMYLRTDRPMDGQTDRLSYEMKNHVKCIKFVFLCFYHCLITYLYH